MEKNKRTLGREGERVRFHFAVVESKTDTKSITMCRGLRGNHKVKLRRNCALPFHERTNVEAASEIHEFSKEICFHETFTISAMVNMRSFTFSKMQQSR